MWARSGSSLRGCRNKGGGAPRDNQSQGPTRRRSIDRRHAGMTDEPTHHESAEARHREFERLVSAIPDAAIVIDPAGAIPFVNDAAFELFGKREADFLGQPIGFA